MARTQKQKAESREAILKSAGKLFREKGVEAVTVAEVMEAAGLTHGGFPRHFSSKQDLVAETVADVLGLRGREPVPASSDLSAFAQAYLRPAHRDARGSGCLFAAMGSEMARAPEPVRDLLTQSINAQIDRFADGHEERRAAAISGWAAMVGAMILARISTSEALSQEILAATKASVQTPKDPPS